MAEPTQQSSPADPPGPTGYGWCAWHQGHAWGVRLIRIDERGHHLACSSCRQAYDLVPLADRP
ncbi:hypothetical protein [Streptomyces glaucus]|uniref:Uncharacterized protein n=1 Tax=Streptomyces glaucus TaxID=284029 RepID=A0ABN3JZ00_9ACTN